MQILQIFKIFAGREDVFDHLEQEIRGKGIGGVLQESGRWSVDSGQEGSEGGCVERRVLAETGLGVGGGSRPDFMYSSTSDHQVHLVHSL